MASLSAPTLQNLISSVRSMLNQPDSNNSFWRDTELTEWLNEGVRIYFGEAVSMNEGLFGTQSDLNITLNTETVALPSDCFKVRALYKKVNNGYELLPYRNNVTDSYSTQGGTSAGNFLPYYYFRGNSLVLRPIPNFSETAGLRLEYIQWPDVLVNGGDSLTTQISPIFKNLIEMYAVYKAKLKESLVQNSQTYAAAQANLGTLYSQFKAVLQPRSLNPTFVIPFNPEFGGY